MPINGLVVMTPTSIASTGTGNSSSIGANGKVTFSSCATLSLNGVFTSSYDNYMIVIRQNGGSGPQAYYTRMRASGTNATTNYVFQQLVAGGTSVSGQRLTAQTENRISTTENGIYAGITFYLFGPYLTQPTAFRSVTVDPTGPPRILDSAGTHSTASSYDGITFFGENSYEISGLLTVFGFNQ